MALFLFAYGANMDTDDLIHRCHLRRRSEVRFLSFASATLSGYKLVTNVFCPLRQSGIMNLSPHPKSIIHGVVYKLLPGDDLSARNFAEGKPNTFRFHTVTVTTTAGKQVPAAVLIASVKGKSVFRPAESYIKIVVDAARHHQLPSAWIDHLRSFPTVSDGTTARVAAQKPSKKSPSKH